MRLLPWRRRTAATGSKPSDTSSNPKSKNPLDPTASGKLRLVKARNPSAGRALEQMIDDAVNELYPERRH